MADAGREIAVAAADATGHVHPESGSAAAAPTAIATDNREADLHQITTNPGSVKINVQGAFIVDWAGSPAESPGTTTESDESDSADHRHDRRDIRLPNHRGLVSHIAVDIGGSLAKLVYFSPESGSTESGGRLSFYKFETERIDEYISFMRVLRNRHDAAAASTGAAELCVVATGGGAYRFYDRIKDALHLEVQREDEMDCLIIGLDFFITQIPEEVFTIDGTPETEPAAAEIEPMRFVPPTDDPYPYLLVNIGSGVSMIKVSGPRRFDRVGGTSLGGGTLWGLLSLLTGARSFDDMLRLSDFGDNTAVDMLVGDIYGTDYSKIGLKSTTIASSFGKVYKMKREAEKEAEDGLCSSNGKPTDDDENGSKDKTTAVPPFRHEDIAKSLLFAVSNNIGQIAYLHAEKHGVKNIYFGGSFIGGHTQTMRTLSFAIKFWSGGEKQAFFLRHEGYLGAVGAFLRRQPPNWGRRNSVDGGSVAGGLGGLRLDGAGDD